MKIKLWSILRENKDPNTRAEVVAQAQVTDLVRRGVTQGLIVKDFMVKSSNMAEQKDGNKTTPNVGHSSQASTSVKSREVENDSTDSSFEWEIGRASCRERVF